MQIDITSDHAGCDFKMAINHRLIEPRHEPRGFGADSSDPLGFPDFVHPAAATVANWEFDRGIVLGGSGNC